MNYITKEQFDIAKSNDSSYWTPDRWEYIATAVDFAKKYCPNMQSSLELGVYGIPTVMGKFADTMDINPLALTKEASQGWANAKGVTVGKDTEVSHHPTYLMDANNTPWPIKSGTYDLFVGLQVLEHLGKAPNDNDGKIAVCKEMLRVAKVVILSLPYEWSRTDAWHRGISMSVIRLWMGGYPVESKICKNGDYSRIVGVWVN